MIIYNNQDPANKGKESSKGNQLKFSVGGNWYKADYLGYEGAAEYLASEILKNSNITNFVPYTLTSITYNEKKFNGCVSPDFLLSRPSADIITFDQFFKKQFNKPISKILESMSIKDRIKWIVDSIEQKTGLTGVGKNLTETLEFDALILNEDRHFNNLAILRTGFGYDLCPLFDNGAGFLSDTSISYPLTPGIITHINNVKAKPFSPSFEKQLNACHELYGEHLKINPNLELSNVWSNIEKVYGNEITERMKRSLDYTMTLYKDKYFSEPTMDLTNDNYESDSCDTR